MKFVVEKASAMGPVYGETRRHVAKVMGFSGNTNETLDDCREHFRLLSKRYGVRLYLEREARDFLLWFGEYYPKLERQGKQTFALKMPQVIVDECLMLCYPFEEGKELSAAAVAAALGCAIADKKFRECAKFFRKLRSSQQ